ncbi:MAG: HAD hydrolase-like protein, partial [Planctomycetes bacterium]|nr:HAD hydrolase-like protein [Planctomycetota bacterium]
MKYQAAIFDFDGTVLNTLEDLADSMNEVLADFAMPRHPTDPYRYFVGDGMENLARRAAPKDTQDDVIKQMVKRMDEKYAANWSKKTCLYDGIAPLLAELRRRRLKLGLLSNKPNAFTQIMVRHYFGDRTFDIAFGAREGVPKKPD